MHAEGFGRKVFGPAGLGETPELGRHEDRLPASFEKLADQLFAPAKPVHVRRIEEVNAVVYGGPQGLESLFFGNITPLRTAQLPSAQTDLRNTHTRPVKESFLHLTSSPELALMKLQCARVLINARRTECPSSIDRAARTATLWKRAPCDQSCAQAASRHYLSRKTRKRARPRSSRRSRPLKL